MSVSISISELLQALGANYKTIDIRWAILREGSEWFNALTVVRLSRKSSAEIVEQQYQLTKRYGQVKTKDFRIHLWSTEFSNWPALLKSYSQGFLDDGIERIKLLQSIDLSQQHAQIRRTNGDLRDDEKWRWPSFEVWCGQHRPEKLQNNQLQRQLSALGWSSPYQAMNALCEINVWQGGPYTYDFYFAVPVYAFIADAKVSSQTNCLNLKFAQHKTMGNLEVLADLKEATPSHLEIVRERVSISFAGEESCGDIKIRTGSTVFPKLSGSDVIEMKVVHKELGEVDSFQRRVDTLIPEPEQNVLLAALKKFCPQEVLTPLLTKPYEQKAKKLKESAAFELRVSWLLGLCGFTTVVLGEYERLLATQTKIERASVDIIAGVAGQKILFVVACTIGTPKEEDFTNLMHACEILRREVFAETSVRVNPIVFTGAVGQADYKEMSDGFSLVPIVDSDRIAILIELLEAQQQRFFIEFIGNPQLSGLKSLKDFKS